MPLAVPAMQATIKSAMDAQYGPPADPAEQAKFTAALAQALFDILTTQALVTSNGATAVGTPGGPLPIAALPGLIT